MNVFCVNVGTRYDPVYVKKLQTAVQKFLPVKHNFICLTNRPKDHGFCDAVDISHHSLPGWWSKMLLFNTSIRGNDPSIYLDLDMVITGDLTPLANIKNPFAICENFTRIAQKKTGIIPTWPCKFGSCCMVFNGNYGLNIWNRFKKNQRDLMNLHIRTGDQHVIEKLASSPAILQNYLPKDYFVHYRDIDSKKPENTSIVVFGGRHNPTNCSQQWIKDYWV